jgi:hypothetical protein
LPPRFLMMYPVPVLSAARDFPAMMGLLVTTRPVGLLVTTRPEVTMGLVAALDPVLAVGPVLTMMLVAAWLVAVRPVVLGRAGEWTPSGTTGLARPERGC